MGYVCLLGTVHLHQLWNVCKLPFSCPVSHWFAYGTCFLLQQPLKAQLCRERNVIERKAWSNGTANHLEVAVVSSRCCCAVLEKFKYPVVSPEFSVAPVAPQDTVWELECQVKEDEKDTFHVRSPTIVQRIDMWSFRYPIRQGTTIKTRWAFFFGFFLSV